MTKPNKMGNILIVLCVIGILLTIGDYLALHDIKNDYVSTRNFDNLGITISGDLPEWTNTRGEWQIVRISFLFRFIFFIFCAIVLYELFNKEQGKHPKEGTHDEH